MARDRDQFNKFLDNARVRQNGLQGKGKAYFLIKKLRREKRLSIVCAIIAPFRDRTKRSKRADD
jgi:hypothetical protein